ncbi:glycosyltransferase family 4 protein [Wolinella succinogenes]|uniref:glycosyltransferase family 4 protein n=1 Tax=Wolinella succinogenes TaxID=844 RepID=UPI002FC75749
MRSKKISFIHHGRVIGGAPTSLKNTIVGLKNEGFTNLKILCAFPDMKPFFEKEAGVGTGDIYSPHLVVGRVFVGLASLASLRTFIYFWLEILKAPYTIWRQIQRLKSEKPDIIHLNSSILFIAAISAKWLGIPLVWHVREVLIGGKWNLRKRFAGWFIRSLADRVICISEVEAKSLGRDTKGNLSVVYNFIDLEKFAQSCGDAESEKERYDIRDQKVYVSLGGVSFRKGTVEIIHAAKKMPEAHFLIAGTYPEKTSHSYFKKKMIGFYHALEDVLIQYKIKDIYSWYYNQRVEFLYFGTELENLKFVGKLDNVAPLINICDALIFAGRTPHFPRPVYEAWALKKPVVVFDMEGVGDNVSDGIDGVVCKSNDTDGLIDAIKSVKPEMGEGGYQKALEKFDMEKNVKKIVGVYGELL